MMSNEIYEDEERGRNLGKIEKYYYDVYTLVTFPSIEEERLTNRAAFRFLLHHRIEGYRLNDIVDMLIEEEEKDTGVSVAEVSISFWRKTNSQV